MKYQYYKSAIVPFGDLRDIVVGPFTQSVSVDYLLIKKENIEVERESFLTGSRLKKRYQFSAENSKLFGKTDYYLVPGIRNVPFNIYSSDVDSGVGKGIQDILSGSYIITDLHNDLYGNFSQAPLQGPFTNHWVGGEPYRHVPLNQGTDTPTDRPEGFYLLISNTSNDPSIGVVDATYTTTGIHDKDSPRTRYLRDGTAKRSVNIANIQSSTASLNLGNYTKNYEVVLSNARTVNDLWFKNNTASIISRPELPVVNVGTADPNFNETLPTRSKTYSVIVNRFSSPGGKEVQSEGYLDPYHGELSPYNALPYRNLKILNSSGSGDMSFTGSTVRVNINTKNFDALTPNFGLKQLLSRHRGKFGVDLEYGSIAEGAYPTVPSFHKVYQNPGFNSNKAIVYDNAFVQHQIPRSELNYSWVTASEAGTNLDIGLILSRYTIPSGTVSVTQSFPSIRENFVFTDGAALNYIGLPSNLELGTTYAFGNLSLASLNQLVTSSDIADFEYAYNLNYLRYLSRGAFGGAAFNLNLKHDHISVKRQREQNTFSYKKTISVLNDFGSVRKQVVLGSSIEPAVVTKFKPVNHNIKIEGSVIPNFYTFGNSIFKFADNDLIKNTNTTVRETVPSYEVLNSSYNEDKLSFLETEFDSFKYRETVFPSSQNMYRGTTRGRQDFNVSWWNSSQDVRTKTNVTGAITACGLACRAYTPSEPGGLSVWPTDGDINFTTELPKFVNDTDAIQKAGALQSTAQLIAYSAVTFNTASYTRGSVIASPTDTRRNILWSPVLSRPVMSSSFSSSMYPEIGGDQPWTAFSEAGKEPFYYSDYEALAEKIRVVGQDHSILPEFRISERIDTYVEQPDLFRYDDPAFLSLTGASIQDSSEDDFYKTYSHSDFLQYFDLLKEDHQNVIKNGKLKLKCSAVKKFIPYEGFYPAQRTVQITELLKKSYIDTQTFGESLGPFYEAFVSPGILFNTVKACIAQPVGVMYKDQYVVGGRSHDEKVRNLSGSHHGDSGIRQYCLSASYDTKLDFEAIFNPEVYLRDHQGGVASMLISADPIDVPSFYPVLRGRNPEMFGAYASDINSEFCIYNDKNSPDIRYNLAINNFFAETFNFFLANKNLTRISSRPSNEFSFLSGSIYKMIFSLNKDKQTDMYSRVSSYGPPFFISQSSYAGNRAGAISSYIPNLPSYLTRVARTPPDDGWVDQQNEAMILSFEPTKSAYTVDELWGGINIEYSRDSEIALITNGDYLSVIKDRNKITSSINLFNKFRTQETDAGDIFSWIIQPKAETPVLDFSHRSGVVPATYTSGTSAYTSSLYEEDYERLFERNVGIWHQYGRIPSGSQGLFMGIEDASGSLSLADAVGFPKGQTGVGTIADFTEVKEAVVAIPFVSAQEISETHLALTEDSDSKRFIAIDNEISIKIKEYILSGKKIEKPDVDQALIDMYENMSEFVIPPRMDFLNNDGIDPFVMYIFPFSHKFDQQDLSDIWQNLPPTSTQYGDITSGFEKDSVTIEHDLNFDASGGTLQTLLNTYPDKLRWMLFKVKQRANIDYFRKVSTLETNPLLENRLTKAQELLSKNIPITNKIAPFTDGLDSKHGYNWPYDYFSMVELVKLDTEIDIKSGEEQ